MMRRKIYISDLCVDFEDYGRLLDCIHSFPDFQTGAELAAGWHTPGFYDKLKAQRTAFCDIPVTFHAPFTEWCTLPGSAEEKTAFCQFETACSLYREFEASSMVFHTHEKMWPEGPGAGQKRSLQCLTFYADRMTEAGLNMTVENVGYPGKQNVLFDEEQFIRLFDRLPEDVGCLIDTGHALLNGWDIPGLIRRLGSRIRGYHLNNNDGLHDSHYPLYDPDGICCAEDVDTILRAIARFSPDAYLVLEYAGGSRTGREIIHADIRRICRVMDER